MSHLVRRFVGSLSRREPVVDDVRWVESQLLAPEWELWQQMPVADRRHSIEVARRFQSMGQWTREEMAGALLHDIGKLQSGLGTSMRVVATVVGPRTERFRRYHDHEPIGAEMLTNVGSPASTVDLVRGNGRAAQALLDADHI